MNGPRERNVDCKAVGAACVVSVAQSGFAAELSCLIKEWGREMGMVTGIASPWPLDGRRLRQWLAAGHQGGMAYMDANVEKRLDPTLLTPGVQSIVVCSLPAPSLAADAAVAFGCDRPFVASYALCRDYHRVVRGLAGGLATKIEAYAGAGVVQRLFVDSAPVMEKALAVRAGLGWIGRNTLLVSRLAGSAMFLGEIFLSLALPQAEGKTADHCGDCRRCLDRCPTGALGEDGGLDARRCLSYLTIEHHGLIPEDLRSLMGNRIFGCESCQESCPWNRGEVDGTEEFFPRRLSLTGEGLAALFAWEREEFERRTEGTPLRRLGHERWLRNVAVALGNGPKRPDEIAALLSRRRHASELVREHVEWALARLGHSV